MVKIALLGYGTIGGGVADVLRINQESIAKKAGEPIEIKYILDLREFPGDENEDKIVHDYDVIVNDPEVRVVVEAMGGVEPANTFARRAIEAGKHFATSNKALMAEHGAELIALGKEKNVSVLFEASVGGGIPIIRPMNTCLTADVIEEITGILNGTTNYMMTKMETEGSEFADVLKDAQAKGYAEADPTADIEGHDACRKIAILSSLASGRQVDFQKIHTEGITHISATDIRYAKAMGRHIKLLATSRRIGDSYCAMVAPFLLPQEHPLSGVSDVFNAVFVRGNVLGDAMFYGAGAGKLPTASAVVGDVVDIVRHIGEHIPVEWSTQELELVSEKELECAYFVRADVQMDDVKAAFGEVTFISVEGIRECAFVTERMSGAEYEKKAAQLGDRIINMIRYE